MTSGIRPGGGPRLRTPGWAAVILLTLLGGVGCGAVLKNDAHAVFSKPAYGKDRFVRAGDYTVHYVEAGEGPPLVLIPGAFTTYRTWNRVAPELSAHNRILAVDYVGVGDSDKPEKGFRYRVEEQADVLAEMILSLRLSRVNLLGASYGGAVALNLAARHPDLVNKVVCIEGGALITPEAMNYSRLGTLLQWPILGDIIWGFMKSGLFDRITARSVMGPVWDQLSPEEKEEITEIFSANIKTVSRASFLGIYRAITDRIDFTQTLDHMQVPVLYLYGEDSKYRAVVDMNVRRFEERNPNIRVLSFQRGIHELHLQYPLDVTRTILRFLRKDSGNSVMLGGESIRGGQGI